MSGYDHDPYFSAEEIAAERAEDARQLRERRHDDDEPRELTTVERLELVENAWYELTKGELQLVDSDGLPTHTPERHLAAAMWREVERYTTETAVEAEDIEERSDRAIADRVAAALETLWYGCD